MGGEFSPGCLSGPTHVYSTLHICWGAQAGLYAHHGVDKHQMEQKLSGISPAGYTLKRAIFSLRGFDDSYVAPHFSLYEIYKEEILGKTNLEIL